MNWGVVTGGWPSLSPQLTLEGALPLSLRLVEGQGGGFSFRLGGALGRFACCQLPRFRNVRERDEAPSRLVVSAGGWAGPREIVIDPSGKINAGRRPPA
jgi:hypothetical protein